MSKKATEILFYALLCLAPLPLGSYRPWAWSLLALMTALLLVLWAVHCLKNPQAPVVPMSRLWPMLLPFALGLGWLVVQGSPWTLKAWHNPLWQDAHALLPRAEAFSAIALDPYGSGTGIMRLLTYGAVFFLAVQLGRDRRQAQRFFAILAVTGLLYACYGLIMDLSGSHHILWFKKWSYVGSVTATFVNRNHYATYAGFGLILTLGLTIKHAWGHLERLPPGRNAPLRLAMELVEREWFMLIALILLYSALTLTHSRAGLMSAILGLLTLTLAAIAIHSPPGKRLGQALWLGGGLFLAALALAGEDTFERLGEISLVSERRDEVYLLASRAIADAPLLGHGPGTFPGVFRLYRDMQIPDPILFNHAHNTYLEAAVEWGLPALLAILLSLGIVFARIVAGILGRRRDALYPAMGAACAVSAGVHALFDFSLQIPAVALTLAAILGVSYAQSWSTAGQDRRTHPPVVPQPRAN